MTLDGQSYITDENGYLYTDLPEGTYTLLIPGYDSLQIGIGPDVSASITVHASSFARILIGKGEGHNEILVFDPDGALLGAIPTGFSGGDISLAVGDFNGDGVDEIAVARAQGGKDVLIFAIDKPDEPLFRIRVDSVGVELGVVDFDKDGKDDLIVATHAANRNGVKIYSATQGLIGEIDNLFDKQARIAPASCEVNGERYVLAADLQQSRVLVLNLETQASQVLNFFTEDAPVLRAADAACDHQGAGRPPFCDDLDEATEDTTADGDDLAATDSSASGKYGVRAACGAVNGELRIFAVTAEQQDWAEVRTLSGDVVSRFSFGEGAKGLTLAVQDFDRDGNSDVLLGDAKGQTVKLASASGDILHSLEIPDGSVSSLALGLAFASDVTEVAVALQDEGLDWQVSQTEDGDLLAITPEGKRVKTRMDRDKGLKCQLPPGKAKGLGHNQRGRYCYKNGAGQEGHFAELEDF